MADVRVNNGHRRSWAVTRRTVTAPLPARRHIVSELLGDPDRRISGVSAARVDVDDDVVPVCQGSSAAPAWSGCIVLSRNHTQYPAHVGDLPHGPRRLALRMRVLAAGRPPLRRCLEEVFGLFD